jgi:hypothetical protein
MKNYYLITLAILLCYPALSQTGPGGIGNTSDNILWLRAQDLSALASGDTVFSWTDTSGNVNHLSQPVGAFTAEYQTSQVNGFPLVRFNKVNGRLRKTNFTTFPSTAITAIYVNKNQSEASDGVLSYASSASLNNDFLIFNSSNLSTYIGNSAQTSSISANDNAWHIINTNWSNTAGDLSVWKDGSLSYNRTGYRMATTITSGGSLSLAGEQDRVDDNYDANQAHFGDFTEVILYNVALNHAQNIIISNYLAAKYGQTLVANDLYNEDNTLNGDYDFEVAGIGQAADGSNHTNAQGRGIVGMSNPTGLGNDEFLIWGHDAGVLSATETSDVPSTVEARLDRVWRASEANIAGTTVDVGAVDIRFDLSAFGAVVASELRLLVDTDNDGVFANNTPISGATSLGNNIYVFAGVTAIEDNYRFTLGTTNITGTPLPVELTSFTAHLSKNGYVNLNWETSTEINNSHFTIEYSTNGEIWTDLARVEGAGNSSSISKYAAYDRDPSIGNNFYRLKQTDFDGQFSYYQIRKVTVKRLEKTQVFPNPSYGLVTITGSEEELENIKIFTILGKDVSKEVAQVILNSNEIEVDLSTLEGGMYIIKAQSSAHKIYKK